MLVKEKMLIVFSAGMMDAVCPLYHSEVSPANSRGQLVGFHAFLLVTGYVGRLIYFIILYSLTNLLFSKGWSELGGTRMLF